MRIRFRSFGKTDGVYRERPNMRKITGLITANSCSERTVDLRPIPGMLNANVYGEAMRKTPFPRIMLFPWFSGLIIWHSPPSHQGPSAFPSSFAFAAVFSAAFSSMLFPFRKMSQSV